MKKKLVLFGAGKIGRSFIGQVFSRSGYEVVFIDINKELIGLLNDRREYKVIIKSGKGDEIFDVSHVRGVHLGDTENVVAELAGATLAALSVGQQGLPSAIPLIAKALVRRRKEHGEWPLDIIIAENMRNSDEYIAGELKNKLPPGYPLNTLAGLVETSIGKMVPIMSQKDLDADPLQVFAEPYNSLIVARHGFKNPVPDVEFLSPKENIKAWVDRKLFIHNLGHATAAYLGFKKNPGWIYIYEALNDPEILDATRLTMLQSADILMALYPGEFTPSQLEAHVDDLLQRFQNKALGDTIFRVGCDLFRKLSPEDRLVAPLKTAKRFGKPYDRIMEALIAALSFRARDENLNYFPADEKFFPETKKGTEYILDKICKFNSD
jgi:mannitol-1-phosphate 5-dehydrogenase